MARRSLALLATLLQWRPGTAHDGCGLKLVQWNIHGECFLPCGEGNWDHCDKQYPACKDSSVAFLQILFEGGDEIPPRLPDFVGVDQMGDQVFYDTHGAGTGYGQVAHTCGGARGFGVYPFDVAIIFFRLGFWKPITGMMGGCMERVWNTTAGDYRAYVIQGFERQDGSGERIVVVAAHFSHSLFGFPELRKALKIMLQAAGTSKIVILADTNRECHTSSWALLKDVVPGGATSLAGNTLFKTCCFPDFDHCYDRIMAINFPGAQDPLDTVRHKPKFGTFNMHDPLVARLSYPSCFDPRHQHEHHHLI